MEEPVREIVSELALPHHFFVRSADSLSLEPDRAETISWEIFRGRLLPPEQTRAEKTFLSWNIFWEEDGQRSGEPILSVKWDRESKQLHIVRGLLCHVWEGYQAEGNVYLSREVRRWVRELVGTVELEQFATTDELRDELAGRLFHAVVGLSRLPLTSVESPLPGFSLGTFGYFYHAGNQAIAEFVGAASRAAPVRLGSPDLPQSGSKLDVVALPMRSPQELLQRGLTPECSWLETVKLVELALRAAGPAELHPLTETFAAAWAKAGHDRREVSRLLRTMLNEVALSPYTEFVPNLLRFVQALVQQQQMSDAEQIDFLSFTLRQLGRHLTAYDLHTFHHRGANYPDALLLDAALKEYLRVLELQPQFLAEYQHDSAASTRVKRRRRRALRQGWLLRRFYEGLPVPDAPTSPGENARVLPAPHVRVPEEQITNPIKRTKTLYTNDPLDTHLGERGRQVLAQSIADLHAPDELRELGMAVFINRPLGWAKAPGEPDQTLLFAHEAFSRTLAQRRLTFLAKMLPEANAPWEKFQHALAELPVRGVPANRWRHVSGRVVSLADASRVVDDFVLLRTTPGTVREFLSQYPVADAGEVVLIVPAAEAAPGSVPMLLILDGEYQTRVELAMDVSVGYLSRGGREYPAALHQSEPGISPPAGVTAPQ